jgi:hypothetical protein
MQRQLGAHPARILGREASSVCATC